MKTEKKKKLNVVDIIIIIALLAAAVTAGFGIYRGIGDVGEKVTIKYVMEISPISTGFVSNVSEGQGVYDHTDTGNIGTVSAVASSQAYYEGTDSQGLPVTSPMEGFSTLHITISCEAVKTHTGYEVGNGTVLGIGKTLQLRMIDLYCEGKCVSIEVIK